MSTLMWWAIRRMFLFVGAFGLAVVVGEPLLNSVVYGAVITWLFSLETILELNGDE